MDASQPYKYHSPSNRPKQHSRGMKTDGYRWRSKLAEEKAKVRARREREAK